MKVTMVMEPDKSMELVIGTEAFVTRAAIVGIVPAGQQGAKFGIFIWFANVRA